jgi:RNA polymerase sigma factor (sigma-70 family)
MNASPTSLPVAEQLEVHRGFLRGVAYRMLGVLADADDVVQDAFVRAMHHPPADLARPLRPWLVRVTVNLARDRLRRRRTAMTATWLPGLVDDAAVASMSPEHGLLAHEGVSVLLLHALECLTPTQRAVLVLRDVCGCESRDVAAALDLADSNVRMLLHRARQRLAARGVSSRSSSSLSSLNARRQEQRAAALTQLVQALLTDDVALAMSLLRADVVAVGDGGGVYAAAAVPVSGRAKVLALLFGVRRFWPQATSSFAPYAINGAPALLMWRTDPVAAPVAPRAALCIEVDNDGLIHRVYSVLADEKLAALPWELVQQ